MGFGGLRGGEVYVIIVGVGVICKLKVGGEGHVGEGWEKGRMREQSNKEESVIKGGHQQGQTLNPETTEAGHLPSVMMEAPQLLSSNLYG